MTTFFKRYLAVMLMAYTVCAVAHAQEVEKTEQATVSVSVDDMEIDTAIEPAAPQTAKNTIKIHLQDDGTLAGRMRVKYTSGKMDPADAVVAFAQDDNLIESVSTDDEGRFSVSGLEPGQYTAQATITEGSTTFYVEVAAHEADLEDANMFMDATLSPTPDYVTGEIIDGGYVDGGFVDGSCGDCGGEIIDGGCATCGETIVEGGIVDAGYIEEPFYGEEYIVDGGMACGAPCGGGCGSSCGGGFSGGGCCGGGGGGFGSLLGLGGLAGLAGLAGLDDNKKKDRRPVSPSRPHK